MFFTGNQVVAVIRSKPNSTEMSLCKYTWDEWWLVGWCNYRERLDVPRKWRALRCPLDATDRGFELGWISIVGHRHGDLDVVGGRTSLELTFCLIYKHKQHIFYLKWNEAEGELFLNYNAPWSSQRQPEGFRENRMYTSPQFLNLFFYSNNDVANAATMIISFELMKLLLDFY